MSPVLRAATGVKPAIAGAFACALAGCTSISGLSGSSSYACKAPEGVACDSVSGTYANTLQNNLPSQRQRATTAVPSASAPAPVASRTATSNALMAGLPPTPVSLRSAPRILRLWFKPWEDADHDLYDQGYVYVQVDAGKWQIEHAQRQIRESYAPLKAPPRVVADTTDRPPLPVNLKSPPRSSPGIESPGTLRPDFPMPRNDNTTE
jgi:conjugal transfer pilus assembly protein TraV